MLKIIPQPHAALDDYFPAAPHDEGVMLEGSGVLRVPQTVEDAIVVHTPVRRLRLEGNAPGAIFDHLPRPYSFNPITVESIVPTAPVHAPFAAAVGALAGLQVRTPGVPTLDLGAQLSVLCGLAGHVRAVGAAFFRRGEAADTAHPVPVAVRDSLPVVGHTDGLMVPYSTPPLADGSYALLQKAYAQFLRGDARAPIWEPHAATLPGDRSTAESTAHALFSLTGCEPTLQSVHGLAPVDPQALDSRRSAQLVHLLHTVRSPERAAVIVLHAASEQPRGTPTFEGPVSGCEVDGQPLLAGMPLAVLYSDPKGILLYDPLRRCPHLYATPTVQQVLQAEYVRRWGGVFLNAQAAQQEADAVDFPQRLAEALPSSGPYLRVSPETLATLNYTTVTLPAVPQQAFVHRARTVLDAPLSLLARDRVAGATHDAQQDLAQLLAQSRWDIDGTATELTAALVHQGRTRLSLSRDPTSRLFRAATDETPKPLVEHLLALPPLGAETIESAPSR